MHRFCTFTFKDLSFIVKNAGLSHFQPAGRSRRPGCCCGPAQGTTPRCRRWAPCQTHAAFADWSLHSWLLCTTTQLRKHIHHIKVYHAAETRQWTRSLALLLKPSTAETVNVKSDVYEYLTHLRHQCLPGIQNAPARAPARTSDVREFYNLRKPHWEKLHLAPILGPGEKCYSSQSTLRKADLCLTTNQLYWNGLCNVSTLITSDLVSKSLTDAMNSPWSFIMHSPYIHFLLINVS